MIFNQKTIKHRVKALGIGLHSGKPIELILEPLGCNSGIVFYRKDIGKTIKLSVDNVISTKLATTIGLNRYEKISTIEHLLSALYAYNIDNILIIVDGPEIPIMDGSSIPFTMMLDEAMLQYNECPKKLMIIDKEITVKDGRKYVKIEPCNHTIFDYTIDFDNSVIGKSRFIFQFSRENYIKEIARARTFGLLKEIQYLRSQQLALGGSLDNAIVVDDHKILNPDGLRCNDEFVKHKILDAIGDLKILNHPIMGKYSAYMGSHELNFKLVKKVLSENSFEIIELKELDIDKKYNLDPILA